MKVLIEKIILYIHFRIHAGHRKGRGVHPPFAFEFIREVVYGKDAGGLERIENLRDSLLRNRKVLPVTDMGAGAGKNLKASVSELGEGSGKETRSIRDLVKCTAIPAKKGRLLARIVRHMQLERMIELGTGTGISSLYMGLASPNSKIKTCEGSSSIAELARVNFRQMGANNIEVSNLSFREWLPGVLKESEEELIVFLDGDHRGEKMLEYSGMVINAGESRKILILDDIHWSKDMNRAWKKLIKLDEVSLSLELYNTGIVFIHYDVQKEHIIVNF